MTTKKGFTMLRKVLAIVAFMSIFAIAAMAADDEAAKAAAQAAKAALDAAHNSGIAADHYGSIGAGLAIGLAAFGGSFGQGRTAAAALEGIARNPAAQKQIFVPMIISLALIESLVLYAFVIAFVKINL